MSDWEKNRSKLLWEVDSKSAGNEKSSRNIATWDETDYTQDDKEQSDDEIFYATETTLPAPRILNYKEEVTSNEHSLDHLYRDAKLLFIDKQIAQDGDPLVLRDDRVDSGYEDVGTDETGNGNSNILHDSGLSGSLCDSRSEEYDVSDVHVTSEYNLAHSVKDDLRFATEEKLSRRKSCPEPSKFGPSCSFSLPQQISPSRTLDDSHSTRQSTGENRGGKQVEPRGSKLQDITAMTRKLSRPLLRKDDAQDFDDDYDSFNWSISSSKSPTLQSPVVPHLPTMRISTGSVDAYNDVDQYSELTAHTRNSTKPKIKDLDLQPEKHCQRPVMHVQSPTVPALSPDRERFPFTRSSSSNSTSSLSDSFPPPVSAIDPCFRCGRQVFDLDKIGPIRRVLFHKQCFRCVECNSVLNLRNYCQNSNNKSDKQIYCKNHQPAQAKAHVGLDDRNINITMNYPKLDRVNTNIRGSEEERAKGLNNRPLRIRGASTTPKLDVVCGGTYGFSYTGGAELHDSGSRSLRPKSLLSPREMSVEEVEPRRVWTRSAINAASLDLTSPSAGRTAHHFYSYGSRAFSQM